MIPVEHTEIKLSDTAKPYLPQRYFPTTRAFHAHVYQTAPASFRPLVNYFTSAIASRLGDATRKNAWTWSSPFLVWQSRCRFLGQAIDGLKKRLDYQGVYHAYILGQMTEAEFRRTAKEFAYTPKPVDGKWLRSALNCLREYTSAEFSVSELAEMFGTDERAVRRALSEAQDSSVR